MSVADYTKLVRLADYNQHAVSSSQLASKQMMDADRLAAAEEAGFVCAYLRVSASGFASVRGALAWLLCLRIYLSVYMLRRVLLP